MIRRRNTVGRRGPGLASTVAQTAVIAGTATVVSGSVANKQAGRQQAAAQHSAQQAQERQAVTDLQQQVNQLQAQAVQAQISPQVTAQEGDLISQLAKLGELHQHGILSAEEFAQAKARLLNG